MSRLLFRSLPCSVASLTFPTSTSAAFLLLARSFSTSSSLAHPPKPLNRPSSRTPSSFQSSSLPKLSPTANPHRPSSPSPSSARAFPTSPASFPSPPRSKPPSSSPPRSPPLQPSPSSPPSRPSPPLSRPFPAPPPSAGPSPSPSHSLSLASPPITITREKELFELETSEEFIEALSADAGLTRWKISEDWERSKAWVQEVQREDLSGDKIWTKVTFLSPERASMIDNGTLAIDQGEDLIAKEKAGLYKTAVAFFIVTAATFIGTAWLSLAPSSEEESSSYLSSWLPTITPDSSSIKKRINAMADFPWLDMLGPLLYVACACGSILILENKKFLYRLVLDWKYRSPWRMWTASFSHADLGHYLGNFFSFFLTAPLAFAVLLPRKGDVDAKDLSWVDYIFSRPLSASSAPVSTHLAILPLFIFTTAGISGFIWQAYSLRRFNKFGTLLRTRLRSTTALRNPDAHCRLVEQQHSTGRSPPRFEINQDDALFKEAQIYSSKGLSDVLFASYAVAVLSVNIDYAPWWIRIGGFLYASMQIFDDVIGRFYPNVWVNFFKRFFNQRLEPPKRPLPMAHLPGIVAGVIFFFLYSYAWNASLSVAQHLPQPHTRPKKIAAPAAVQDSAALQEIDPRVRYALLKERASSRPSNVSFRNPTS